MLMLRTKKLKIFETRHQCKQINNWQKQASMLKTNELILAKNELQY